MSWREESSPLFVAVCKAHGLPAPTPEYRFAPPRRWRFDWAFIEPKLAVEIQGGTFSGGRHTRGGALRKEYEKLNAAACLGWRVLMLLPEQVKSGAAFEIIGSALDAGPVRGGLTR